MATFKTASREGYGPERAEALRKAVAEAVTAARITDLHTHLYAPAFGPLLLWGIDELLTYHYLIAEAVRASNIACDDFYAMDKRAQADFVWQELFVKRSPLSESCRGVLTVLRALGLDTASRDLEGYRAWFAERDLERHIDDVFDRAGIDCAVMTNDPFDETERPAWLGGYEGHPRFHAALRIDPLLNDWTKACERLRGWGYDVEPGLKATTKGEVRRFLSDWMGRMKALYMAVSLPPDFAFPEDSPRGTIIAECVLPVARECDRPFAMMIGVKRAVNPALRLAGDGVGAAALDPVQHLCANHPGNRFMVTTLARENQHELTVMARKFPNLFLFGCWWFLNNPSLIEEMTRMRIELLGLSVAPQHSDARVLEQVIYKWEHSRAVIGKVLQDKYADLAATGWSVTDDEIRRDVDRLFGGNFWDFVGGKR
jgi:hypothetical protein